MAALLIIAHAPLATALRAVAGHVYPEGRVDAIDVPADMPAVQVENLAAQALARLGGTEVLVLTDVFGATPCNAAMRVADGQRARVVTGVSVPMLWRALCYCGLPLDQVVERALDGGRQGALPVSAPGPQNQAHKTADHAQVHAHHQQ